MESHNAERMDDDIPVTGIQKFLGMASLSHVDIADVIKAEVKEGNVDPIQAMLAIKRMSKIVEITTDSSKGDKELRAIFLNATQKALNGGKSVDMFGANLRVQATGVWYDFGTCKDIYLDELYRIRTIVEEAIKARETEIKVMLPAENNKTLGIRSRTIVQEHMPHFEWLELGQDNVIFPPVKMGGESVIVTFKK